MAAGNRAITFLGPDKMELQDKGYPKHQDPKGRKIEHAVILKIITTNICGSDLHIFNSRFAALKGMQMGHENTAAQLLGASCIIVGDHLKARRDLVKEAGHEVVDPSSTTRVADQIEKLLGTRQWIVSASGSTAMGRTAVPRTWRKPLSTR